MGSANPIVLNVPVNVDALKSNKMQLIHNHGRNNSNKTGDIHHKTHHKSVKQ